MAKPAGKGKKQPAAPIIVTGRLLTSDGAYLVSDAGEYLIYQGTA